MQAYIALGSNVGDRHANIAAALERLRSAAGITDVRVSGCIETKPVDCPPGSPDFLNAVAEVETSLAPRQLFSRLQKIEQALGRVRGERNAPRTIDLDLILYGDSTIDEPDLVVPHPRTRERRFVLDPLLELAPGIRDPKTGETYAAVRAALDPGVSA